MNSAKTVTYIKPSIIKNIAWRLKRLFKKVKGDYKPEKSNLYLWAKSELDRLIVYCEEKEGKDGLEMQKTINKNILDIVKVFCMQGHSGTSASYLISKVTRLLDWKPITALTGENSEWMEVPEYDNGNKTQQNKYCSAVFRDNCDNATAHYIYGRVYSDNGGHSWFTTNRGTLKSFTPVVFPFYVPNESEYVYLNGKDSEEIITDKARIKELYEEYNKKFKE